MKFSLFILLQNQSATLLDTSLTHTVYMMSVKVSAEIRILEFKVNITVSQTKSDLQILKNLPLFTKVELPIIRLAVYNHNHVLEESLHME